MTRDQEWHLIKDQQELSNGIYVSKSLSVNARGKLEVEVIPETKSKAKEKKANALETSIELIKDSHGQIKIKELYETLNVSKSTLEQYFIRETGLTPKEFCKITKLNHFIASYENNEAESLTELTYKCGYYDQSHLIKDFKYFLDTSPRRYFLGRN